MMIKLYFGQIIFSLEDVNENTNKLTMTELKLGWQKHLLQYLKYDYCSTTYGKKVK